MADNKTLPSIGGNFIARMKEFAGAIYASVPLIGHPTTGDPFTVGRKAAADTLSFSVDEEAKADLASMRTQLEALAGILAAYGITATAEAPTYVEGVDNLPLSTNLFGALRMFLTDPETGEEVDLDAPSGVFSDLPVPLTPYLAMTSNTSEQNIQAARGSGIFSDLYGIIITNTSVADVVVAVRDTTAGAVRMYFKIKAGEMKGFVDAASIMQQTTANTNWTVQMPSGNQAGVHVTAWFKTRLAA